MFHHLTDALIAWGPAGILLLAILDSSGVPVAGVFDALLILIAVERPSVAWLCAGMAVVGSTVGNVILFWMARKGGQRFMNKAAPEGRAAIPPLVPALRHGDGVYSGDGADSDAVEAFRDQRRSDGDFTGGVRGGDPAGAGAALFRRGVAGFYVGTRIDEVSDGACVGFLAGAVALFLILYGLIRWRDRGRTLRE